jgi:hypothetical protein
MGPKWEEKKKLESRPGESAKNKKKKLIFSFIALLLRPIHEER